MSWRTRTPLATRCRNLAEQIRNQLGELVTAHNNRVLAGKGGEWAGRIDDVYVGPDLMGATGDRFIAEAAAKLFRQSGLRNVEVYEHCSKPGTWVASGGVR